MTLKQEGASNLTLAYPNPGQAHPHAVNGTTGTQTLTGFAYDPNGNMNAQGTSTYTFDAENRLKTRSVAGGTMSYAYDGTGTLLKKTNADDSWTAYAGDGYEKRSDGSVVKYYELWGRVVAMRVNQNPVQYILQDHLGSTTRLLDSAGNPVAGSDLKYWPYGATRSGAQGATDRMYTSQRIEPGDAALGLYNYKARFYSTTLGRFVSADPVTRDGLNRYQYVRNNPLTYTDPFGNCFQLGGVQVGCNGEGDVLAWLNCAATCGGWYGDVARWAVGWDSEPSASNPNPGFWTNFRRFETTTTWASALTAVAAAAASDWGAIDRMPWRFWGEAANHFWVPVTPFIASFRALISGSLAPVASGSLSDDDFVGSKPWWSDGPRFGDVANVRGWERFMSVTRGAEDLEEFMFMRTIGLAGIHDSEWFNRGDRLWSKWQIAILSDPRLGVNLTIETKTRRWDPPAAADVDFTPKFRPPGR